MKNCKLSLMQVLCISFFCFFLSTQARRHNHKHKHTHPDKPSYISQPPSPPPDSASPPEGATNPNNSSSGVFDVRSFGAVGDGQTDDTEAFKMAWDTACQSESAARILVPRGFSFMIQSTIFTGPCLGGLVLQVMYLNYRPL